VRGLRSGEIGAIMSRGVRLAVHRPRTRSSSVETAFTLSVAAIGAASFRSCGCGRRDGPAPRCLDGGALGVFVSHVDTAADAQAAVEALRFPPLGHRSAGGNYPACFRGGAGQDVIPRWSRHDDMATLETKRRSQCRCIAAVPHRCSHHGMNDLSVDMGIRVSSGTSALRGG